MANEQSHKPASICKPSQGRLKELFAYDVETGELVWNVRKRGSTMGKVAGCKYRNGYTMVRVDGVRYLAHRLVWLYHHGKWPDAEIDHINRNPSDNRIENLRPATRQQNIANYGVSKANKSGFKGVWFHKDRARWIAQIQKDGKIHWLGAYKSAEDAASAYRVAAERMFGEYAA